MDLTEQEWKDIDDPTTQETDRRSWQSKREIEMLKIPYITEIGTILAAIGAACLGVYHGIDSSPEWINGVGLFCGSVGGALIGMRVSKKLSK